MLEEKFRVIRDIMHERQSELEFLREAINSFKNLQADDDTKAFLKELNQKYDEVWKKQFETVEGQTNDFKKRITQEKHKFEMALKVKEELVEINGKET